MGDQRGRFGGDPGGHLEDGARPASAMRDRGFEVQSLICDITDPAHVRAMASQVEANLGPVDTLVNNAGTFSVIAPVWEADDLTGRHFLATKGLDEMLAKHEDVLSRDRLTLRIRP